jgi:hypothetical protein
MTLLACAAAGCTVEVSINIDAADADVYEFSAEAESVGTPDYALDDPSGGLPTRRRRPERVATTHGDRRQHRKRGPIVPGVRSHLPRRLVTSASDTDAAGDGGAW